MGYLVFACVTLHMILWWKQVIVSSSDESSIHYYDVVMNFVLFITDAQWADTGLSNQMLQQDKYIKGFVAWCASLSMVVTSLPWVRRQHYNVFRYAHFAYVLFFVFAYLHTPAHFLPYLATGVALYAADKLLRAVAGLRPHYTTSLECHDGLVRLGLPKRAFARFFGLYRPGQYVRSNTCVVLA